MGTETQDNWNELFGNKKAPRYSKGRYIVFTIVILTLSVSAFLNKDYLAQMFRDGFGSSFDGIEMSNMVSKVNDIIEENKEYVNEFISVYSINNSSNKADYDYFIDEWLSYVTDSMNDLARINYHKSYTEFMSAAKYTLYTTEQFINDFKAHKLDNMNINTGIDKIKNQSEVVFNELVKAFDNNQIIYTKSEDGRLSYRYSVK